MIPELAMADTFTVVHAMLMLVGMAVGSVLLRQGAALSGVPPRENSLLKAVGAVALVAAIAVAATALLALYWAATGSFLGLLATVGFTIVVLRRLYRIATGEAFLLTLAGWVFLVSWAVLVLDRGAF